MTHLNHLSLYVSQVAWFLPVSFFNVQIYFLVLLLVLNTIESDGFLWRASRRLKTLFLAHSCFQTRRSSFLEPTCLPNTRNLFLQKCRIRVTMLMIQDILIKARNLNILGLNSRVEWEKLTSVCDYFHSPLFF